MHKTTGSKRSSRNQEIARSANTMQRSAYLQRKVAFGEAASSFAARLLVHRDVRADRLRARPARVEHVVEVLDRLRTLRLAGLLALHHAAEHLLVAEPLGHVEVVWRSDEEAALVEAGAHATAVRLQIGRVFVHFATLGGH